jgi:hypothetical protein
LTGKKGRNRQRAAAALSVLLCCCLLAALAGCGGKSSYEEKRDQVEAAAANFLDACGNQDAAAIPALLSPGYREANGLGDTLSAAALQQAVGSFVAYSFDPVNDIVVEDGRGLVTVFVDYGTFGSREETLVLVREGDAWLVDNFTAMDWRMPPPAEESAVETDVPEEDVERALRGFLEACLDGDTGYIFKHLSDAYKEEYRLTKAWTASEFAGIFGTARSYDFEPEEIEMIGDDRAQVDVTIDFGSRGNLESETSLVSLVLDSRTWKVDVFPFFIY